MEYKAAVFDIDGTLLPRGGRRVPHKTVKAINRLKKTGVKIIIATGRGPVRTSSDVLGRLKYDYIVCVNGACVLNKDREVFFQNSFSRESLDKLLATSERLGVQLKLIYLDGYYIFYENKRKKLIYREYEPYKIAFEMEGFREKSAPERNDGELPLGGFVVSSERVIGEFSRLAADLRFIPFSESGFDICKIETDKVNSLDLVLKALGVSWDQTVVMGDGKNDEEMIRRAGLGVAMANSSDELKAVADIVAPDCRDFGVCSAINDIFKL